MTDHGDQAQPITERLAHSHGLASSGLNGDLDQLGRYRR